MVQWILPREALANTVAVLLTLDGHDVAKDGLSIVVEGIRIRITAECTYLDLLLCVLPFTYRQEGIIRFQIKAILIASTVWLLNTVRVYAAIACYLEGISWYWAHDVVDYILWYPCLLFAIYTWYRWQRRALELQ
jgi:exosortase/archaeosortase